MRDPSIHLLKQCEPTSFNVISQNGTHRSLSNVIFSVLSRYPSRCIRVYFEDESPAVGGSNAEYRVYQREWLNVE